MSIRRELRQIRRGTTRRLRPATTGAASRLKKPVSAMRPIFVGGTGRSGTTVTSGLLGRHPDYKRLYTEVKFISNRGGLTDLVEGRTTVDAFEQRILEKWFDRGDVKGLKMILERDSIEAALPELRDGAQRDVLAAAARFAHRLLDPLAVAEGAQGWIEMTPNAALTADTLDRMFPEMKLLHLVRDGRDVACSVLKMRWGPKEPHEALDWWAKRLEQGFAACAALPADKVHVIQLEDLVVRDRDRQYAQMLEFLGMTDDPTMRTFFDERMPADAMHGGRWRRDIPAEEQDAFDAHYWQLADRLNELGYPYRGEPREPAETA